MYNHKSRRAAMRRRAIAVATLAASVQVALA